MSLRDNKMAVLRQLGQESEPISLNELLDKLGSSFKERSVRRWLQQLVGEGTVLKMGEKRGSKYCVVGCTTEQGGGAISSCFSSASLDSIEKIKKPLFERNPVTYSEDWIEEYRPNVDNYLPLTVQQQLQEAGQRANAHDPAGTYAHQIFNRLLIDLSYRNL